VCSKLVSQVSSRSSNAAGVAQRDRLTTVSIAAAVTGVTTGLHATGQQIRNTIPSSVDRSQIDVHVVCMSDVCVFAQRVDG